LRASEPAGEILSGATLVAESKDLRRSRYAGVVGVPRPRGFRGLG
jgi:hypothetical protein